MNDDTVIRAVTEDGSFRAIALQTTQTVAEVAAMQQARGAGAKLLSDLVTGTILVRETMSPQNRVQGLMNSADRKSRLVADSHPDGTARGLIQTTQDQEHFDIGPGCKLHMMRTLFSGQLHQGIVEVPSQGGVSAGLMAYMQESEQTTSIIAVETIFEGDAVQAAGGYIVQLLPEAKRGALAIMTERMSQFPSLDTLLKVGGLTSAELLGELLYGMPYAQTQESELSFGCACNQVRMLAALANLQQDEIAGMVAAGHPIELACDFCRKNYQVTTEQLRGLLASS